MSFTHETLQSFSLTSNTKGIAITLLSLVLAPFIYRLYFHPLKHVPGPWLGRVSPLFLYTICYLGIEGRVLRFYHEKYKSDVIRIAPNSVSISNSAAIQQIYISGGGYLKDERYKNFNLGPIVSIFSAIDTKYRDFRAKAVAPLFSTARLRAASEADGVIRSCVSDFVYELKQFKAAATNENGEAVKLDILDLSARLSIDIVTGYLLGKRYGGFLENRDLSISERQNTKLSANPFIFAIVAFARFSLLPNWGFKLAYTLSSKLNSNEQTIKSFIQVDQFAQEVVDFASSSALARETTYQGRLLSVGLSPEEVSAQSKAIIFAGADSVAVVLATVLFHLVQRQSVRRRLLEEIQVSRDTPKDPSNLPYLRAVVKEGLRLSMANPTRFTRVVPEGGLSLDNTYIPEGTVVGCAPYVLHHDATVFPRPFEFCPERWLEDGQDDGLKRPEMQRSILTFGAGLRACIGKNLAYQQLYETVVAVVHSGVLDGSRTCQREIEIIEWFNAEIKEHKLDIEWLKGSNSDSQFN